MRSTFNILFYVNKSKEKNGMVPVMGRVTINGTQSQFSCKKSIPLDIWDVKGNQKKRVGKDRAASTLWAMERSRKDVADFIQSHYRRTDMSMQELTPEFIKDFAA